MAYRCGFIDSDPHLARMEDHVDAPHEPCRGFQEGVPSAVSFWGHDVKEHFGIIGSAEYVFLGWPHAEHEFMPTRGSAVEGWADHVEILPSERMVHAHEIERSDNLDIIQEDHDDGDARESVEDFIGGHFFRDETPQEIGWETDNPDSPRKERETVPENHMCFLGVARNHDK